MILNPYLWKVIRLLMVKFCPLPSGFSFASKTPILMVVLVDAPSGQKRSVSVDPAGAVHLRVRPLFRTPLASSAISK
eukprot:33795_1